MKKIIIIFSLLFSINSLDAQVSGYMGKKVSIYYNFGMGIPHIRTVNYLSAHLNINHGVNLDYIIGNSVAFGVRYKLGINSIPNEPYSFVFPKQLNISFLEYKENMTFYSHTVSSYFKFYRRNSLAPIGAFTMIGIGIQDLELKNVYRKQPKVVNFNPTEVYSIQDYSQFDFILNFGIGRNWIIFDYALLGFQIETGFPVASTFRTIQFGPFSDDEYNSKYNGYPTTNISSRINFSNELLRISLNIGFLAF